MKTKEIVIRFTDNSGIIFNYLMGTPYKYVYLKLNGWKIFEGRDSIAILQDSFFQYVNKILYGFAILILLTAATNIISLSMPWLFTLCFIGIISGIWCVYWVRQLRMLIDISLYRNEFRNMIDDVQEWRDKNRLPPFKL